MSQLLECIRCEVAGRSRHRRTAGFTPAAGPVVEWIHLLEQMAAAPVLALTHTPPLAVLTTYSLHLTLPQPTSSEEGLIVSHPKHSRWTVPRYNPQWLRPRHQLAPAPGLRTTPPALRHLRVPGPSLLKTLAPERVQLLSSFSCEIPPLSRARQYHWWCFGTVSRLPHRPKKKSGLESFRHWLPAETTRHLQGRINF
jgi:hypothetical protein